MVSKYIGETEKNLTRVFDAAEDAGAALLFDEVDAMLGKRLDVKDNHVRLTNNEVCHLLQSIETYRGLAILATNWNVDLDQAFLRRLSVVLDFLFPDLAARRAIWRTTPRRFTGIIGPGGGWPARRPGRDRAWLTGGPSARRPPGRRALREECLARGEARSIAERS